MTRPSWERALRAAGPLAEPAERFLVREGRAEAPSGAEALAWLARRIDAFAGREAVGAQEESAFVEGAGAFLALVLLEHVEDGSHVARDGAHRVRLGRAGFFDPFAAVERALDADSARVALIDEVARAEQEARGTGGIAAAALAFERLLGEARADLRVVDRFEQRLWLVRQGEQESFEVDLGRVIGATAEQRPGALEQALGKVIALLPGGPGHSIARDEAVERLLPRLVGPTLRSEVGTTIFSRSLAHDVEIALVLAYDGRSRFVRATELEAWGLDPRDALELAVRQLAARSARARFTTLETDAGSLVMARSGDGLDSARLLLPGLHDVLADALGDAVLAAVPHRDVLLAGPAHPDALRRALATRAADDAARAPHRISAALFAVTPTGPRAA